MVYQGIINRMKQEKVDGEVHANWGFRNYAMKFPLFDIKKKFIEGCKKSLSVGCGAYEPFYINATHACDLSPVAKKYLDQLGWQGEFKACPCYYLDYKDKEFDAAVCCEVIEHLDNIDQLKDTLRELTRVSKTWIATTPLNKVSGVRDKWNTHPGHILFLSKDDINWLIHEFNVTVEIVRHEGLAWMIIKYGKD